MKCYAIVLLLFTFNFSYSMQFFKPMSQQDASYCTQLKQLKTGLENKKNDGAYDFENAVKYAGDSLLFSYKSCPRKQARQLLRGLFRHYRYPSSETIRILRIAFQENDKKLMTMWFKQSSFFGGDFVPYQFPRCYYNELFELYNNHVTQRDDYQNRIKTEKREYYFDADDYKEAMKEATVGYKKNRDFVLKLATYLRKNMAYANLPWEYEKQIREIL